MQLLTLNSDTDDRRRIFVTWWVRSNDYCNTDVVQRGCVRVGTNASLFCHARFTRLHSNIQCLGSGVLDILYVATGRLDVVYAGVANEGWKPWDYCAALVIAVEAGCSIESLVGNEGKELDIYDKSIICAGNQQLLQDCRRVIVQGL